VGLSNGTTTKTIIRRGSGHWLKFDRATREGWCYEHVQAIIVSIDQYAEAATGNRQFFLNKPHSAGEDRKQNIP
jgi:hypothetical protein